MVVNINILELYYYLKSNSNNYLEYLLVIILDYNY
jgi:hypothetical protein